jgi:hypothetical protein
MRFMVLVKATPDSESGRLPARAELAELGEFNEELVKAGVLLAADGLQASSKGSRVTFSDGRPVVIDGPFAETKELVAGYWIWQVDSLADAIEWAKRCPAPPKGEWELEIRQVFEAEDFGDEFTPGLREREERIRAEAANN